uniref:hypothetical protein n=1 Tax=Caviibacter abscessus TaxID=1766719 RepID=UPI0009EBFACD
MKKNRKLLLSLAALSASTMTYTKVEDKVKAEVTFGVDTHFGADGAEKASRMALPAMDLIFAKKVQDYDKKKNPTSQSVGEPAQQTARSYYLPKYPENRDLDLAIRYISKEYKFRKRLGIKLSEDYFGLRLGLDIIGKDNDYENFIEKNEIDKLKLTLTSENKYLNGTLKYYVIGEEKKKYGIDKIEEEKEKIGNKEVDYNVTFNPLADHPVQAFVNVRGQGKIVEINPSFGGAYKGFYFNVGPMFAINREKLDVNEEIENISYAAPGYDKIEYFKKWEKKKDVDLSTEQKYKDEHADLSKAEVSGYKGTYRLLGYYSGSLFGDSPVKLAVNTLLDEVHNNKKTETLSKLLKDIENGNTNLISLGLHYGFDYQKIVDEAKDKATINLIATNVTKKLLDRAGIGYGRKTSHLGLIKQVPNDFKQLFPGLLPNFDLFGINMGILDPTYLYFNGFTYNDPKIPNSSIKPTSLSLTSEEPNSEIPQALTVSKTDYELTNRWHYIGEDIFNYSLQDFENYYGFQTLAKKFTEGNWWTKFTSIFSVPGVLGKATELLQNPYEMRGIDLTRAMYFHASEKEKNIFKVEETLAKIKLDLANLDDAKQVNNISAKLNAGYVGNGYRIDLHSRINDRTNITSESKNLNFTKIQHTAGINVQGMYKGFVAQTSLDTTYTDVSLKYTKNGKDKNAEETVLKYKDINLVTQTYLGYRIKAGSKWDIDLGLSHYGEYGYIMPEKFTIGGTEYKLDVVKRDEKGNPKDLDGTTINVGETTEKILVDKAFEKRSQTDKKDEKSKRKFNADDALKKEKKPLENSWRSIYNILSPKIGVTYRPYKSFEIRNEFQLPVAFNKNEFSGVNIMYKTEFKYLLGSSDFDIFTDMNKAFNLRTKGKVDAGIELVERNGVYANYDIFADLSVAKLSLYGKNLDPNIDL